MNIVLKNRAVTNLKYFLTCFFTIETLLFFFKKLFHEGYLIYSLRYILLGVVFTLIPIFLYHLMTFLKKIILSRRFDILLSIGVSLFTIIVLHSKILYTICGLAIQLDLLGRSILACFIFLGYILIDTLIIILVTQKTKDQTPLFISDEAEKDKDALDIKQFAKTFANQVLNNGSSNSIVFGLDAPWGSGKSTYINFCKSYWENCQNNDKIVVLSFEPLRFENKKELFNIFVQELLKTIHKSNFIPEISGAIDQYLKVVSNIKFSLKNFEFTLPTKKTEMEIFEELKENLILSKKKVIVIIDDLDRLYFEDIKVVLDIVKKTFVLPNITYILCYDTENINTFENVKGVKQKVDNSKIVEYFEKVVNIKKTLIVPGDKLKRYFLNELAKIKNLSDKNKFSDELSYKITHEIDNIFNSKLFYQYSLYLGDIRKLKRILNIIIMVTQEIPNLELDKRDIDFNDLLHLILIYINYPDLFRSIYISETGPNEGIFSLKWKYDPTGSEHTYINTDEYNEFYGKLNTNKRFLLAKVFSAEKYKEKKPTREQLSNSAAFNGTFGTGRNLINYLELIAKGQVSTLADDYTFHLQNANEFLKGNKTLEEIYKNNKQYQFTETNNGDKYLTLFFHALFGQMDKITLEKTNLIVKFILNLIKKLSPITNDTLGIKLRGELPLDLINLLNAKGWQDADGKNYDNSNSESLKEIAEIIFGEGKHKENGIITTLSEEQRGILGFNDLLTFRLYCSYDRSGGFYNVYNSLIHHSSPNTQINGEVTRLTIIEMREISQKCFDIFNTQYINTKKNIFDEVNNLSEPKLLGLSKSFVIKEKSINLQLQKNNILSFIVYQSTNAKIQMGIGCGYYDPTGDEDKKTIQKKMNEYLFNICFNVETNPDNAIYFVDYLLTQLVRHIRNPLRTIYELNFNELLDIFDYNQLKAYWEKNREFIKNYTENKRDRIVDTNNYTATYTKDLPLLFDILDQNINKS